MGLINDNAEFLLTAYTWLCIILRNSVYPIQVVNWYSGVFDPTKSIYVPFSCSYFVKTMKIFINKKGYPNKPTWRNIVFNWMRCETAGIVYSLCFGGQNVFFKNENELIYKLL